MNTISDERAALVEFIDEHPFAQTTAKAYVYLLTQLFTWLENRNLTLYSATASDLKDYIAQRGWGNALANKLNSVVRKYAHWKYGTAHPLTKWRIKRLPSGQQRCLTLDQVSILMACFQPGISKGARSFQLCDTSHPLGIRNYAIVSLMLDSGLRAAEVCRLEISKMNLETGVVTTRVKGGQIGFGFFSHKSAELIQSWLRIRPEFATDHSQDYLWLGLVNSHRGRPMGVEGLKRLIRVLGRVSGIGPLSPHDLRRTFGTLTRTVGKADLFELMRAGNWKSIQTTLLYTRYGEENSIRPKLIRNFV